MRFRSTASATSVRPGVTGWAQVQYKYGASMEDALEKLQYELYLHQEHVAGARSRHHVPHREDHDFRRRTWHAPAESPVPSVQGVSSMSENVILLEFNELSPTLMNRFIGQGHLPNFKRFSEEAAVYLTEAEERAPYLDPWIQWITVHTGLNFQRARHRAPERRVIPSRKNAYGISSPNRASPSGSAAA